MPIIDGTTKAHEEGIQTYEARMRGIAPRGVRWKGEFCDEPPVKARIDFGRLIADCECGGAEYVTKDYPWFFCFSCGNQITGGCARPVDFSEV